MKNISANFTESQWDAVLTQFEDSVSELSDWLEKTTVEKRKTQEGIEKLEAKISRLRKNEKNTTNVFEEIQLKRLLNSLKENLEKNSNLQHEWDEKQKDFEQKSLSLTSLYNDRIALELENSSPSPNPTYLDTKLALLNSLVKKRNRLQLLTASYQKKGDTEKLLSLTSLDSLGKHDRENLQLTMDLFRDRKKDLSEQLEKWSIEEDQAKNELKLQVKMQDFLEDIRQINEDTDIPHGGLKRHDLEGLAARGQKGKLETRISDLHEKINQAQKTLIQISQLMMKVQHQLDSLNERKKQ